MRKKTFLEEQIALDFRDVEMGIAELRRLRQMEEETHHSIQVTVDTYGHLVPGANREAVDRLDDLLEKPSEPAPQAHPPLLGEASTSPPSPANA